MVETIFQLSRGDEKAIEKVVFDENVHYLHMVFNQNVKNLHLETPGLIVIKAPAPQMS